MEPPTDKDMGLLRAVWEAQDELNRRLIAASRCGFFFSARVDYRPSTRETFVCLSASKEGPTIYKPATLLTPSPESRPKPNKPTGGQIINPPAHPLRWIARKARAIIGKSEE